MTKNDAVERETGFCPICGRFGNSDDIDACIAFDGGW